MPPMLLRYATRLRGRLDVSALQAALVALIERHEALRTCFQTSSHGLAQAVYSSADLPLERADLTGSADPAADLAAFITQIAGRPIPLDRAPLMRVGLAELATTEHVLVVAVEHMVGDGWSMSVLLEELAQFYGAAVGEGGAPTQPAPSWLEWTLAERAWVESDGAAEEIDRWRLALATDHVTFPQSPGLPKSRKHIADRRSARVDATEFRTVMADAGVSLSAGLLTCFGTALAGGDPAAPIWVATPVLNRSLDTEESLVGWLANQRPVAVPVQPGATFDDVVQDVQSDLFDALEYGRAAVDELVRLMTPDRWGRVPPVLAAFTPPYGGNPPIPPGLTGAAEPIDVPLWTMGIGLDCIQQPDNALDLRLIWDAGTFSTEVMTRLLDEVERTMTAATADPLVPCGR